MSEKPKPVILFVDDEESILRALKRLLRKQPYDVYTASGGEEALTFLENHGKPVSLIVSDQRMPGMSGAVFLEKAKEIEPDAMRFLLTGYSDMNAIIDSVNKGEIHKYITKPWSDDDLLLQINMGLEHYELKTENKRLLAVTREQNKKLYDFGKMMDQKVKEEVRKVKESAKKMEFLNKELELNLLNTVRAFAALNEMHIPLLKGHGKRTSRLAIKIAEKMNLQEDEVTSIEIAAILHDIGKAGYSDKMLRYIDNPGSSGEDKILYKRHPENGQAIVAFISHFDEVGLFVRNHHERFDGSGYPDGLSGEEIPLGARIIAIADIYDRITNIEGNNSYLNKYLSSLDMTPDYLTDEAQLHNAAVEFIRKNSFKKYDPDVVKAFLDSFEDNGETTYDERQIQIEKIEPGMVLGRAMYTNSGRFLLPHKTELNPGIIKKLFRLYKNGEINNQIFIL